MSLLEQELAALAPGAFPGTPDLAGLVRARLDDLPETHLERRTRRRKALVLVLAIVAVALGAAFAVPQARSTILRWFDIGGVSMRFVDRLPVVRSGTAPAIGVPVPLDEAQARVGFRVLVPDAELGAPDAVYVGHFSVDEVTFLYGTPDRIRLLLTEIQGELNTVFAQKFVQTGTVLKKLTVGGRAALWIERAPHEFLFVDSKGRVVSAPLRLDQNTLLWQRQGLVLRLEGDLTLAQALRVAASL